MNIWALALKFTGWSFSINVPAFDKCVICVAPHTSNLDFILGLSAYRSVGRKANFLMKSFWFFFPLNFVLRYFGGIPVHRSRKRKHGSLTANVIKLFDEQSYVNLAVTPEGTRSATDKWKTGFLYIAYGAKVPVLLAVIDYAHRHMEIDRVFWPSGDVDADMSAIRNFYRDRKYAARFPDKFIP